jgi:imidazolonepropionase-like amidohydrolase
MKSKTLFTICCWLLLIWTPSIRAEQAQTTIVLIGGVVIDGNGGMPIENAAVVIGGRKILAVGDANTIVIPEDAQVIDVTGKAILPGLADMHVHLMGGWDGESSDMLGYQRYLDALLYAGVTTVLDMGNVMPFVVQLRDEIAAGNLLGPRIYCVGPLVDGPAPRWPSLSIGLVSEAQVPDVVSLLERAQVDAVKGYKGLSNPILAKLVSAAADRSLPVFVDVGERNGSFDIAVLGISAFAHVPTQPLESTLLEFAADNDIRFVTTLAQQERSARRRFDDLSFLEHPLIADTHPPIFIEALREYAMLTLTDGQESWAARSLINLQFAFSNVRALAEAGVLIVAGTDAPYPGVIQGEGIHRELELLVEAGMSPLEAISTATSNAAELMGAEDWGSIEVGKVADLIVVNGRPDLRISDSRKIHLVMQNGGILDRDALKFDPANDLGFGTGLAVDDIH